MDIGQLSRRFEVQKPVRTQNDFGEVTIAYQKIGKRWGSLRAITGIDRLNASQISSEVTHNVVMRKDALGIQPDYRLKSCGRIFDVVQVFDPDDQRKQLNLEVSEVISV